MSEVIPFEFHDAEVRAFNEDGTLWFVAKDVTDALGYLNSHKALKDHCKGVTKRYPLTEGGRQGLNVIGEPDLYRLVFGSKLESAKKFANWVFEDVLPTLRKTGTYTVDQPLDPIMAAMNTAEEVDRVLQVTTLTPDQRRKLVDLSLESQGHTIKGLDKRFIDNLLEESAPGVSRSRVRDLIIETLEGSDGLSEAELLTAIKLDDPDGQLRYLEELDRLVREGLVHKYRTMHPRFGGNGWAVCYCV